MIYSSGNITLLIVISVIGVITSISDIRHGKIRNKHLAPMLLVGLLLNYILSIDSHAFFVYSINVIMSSLVGFSLWELRLWSAGDGKLFIVYSALLPLASYKVGFVSLFPSFTLLFNTFLLGLFFMLYKFFIETSYSQKELAVRNALNFKAFLTALLFLLGLMWFSRILFEFSGLEGNILLSLFFTYLLLSVFSRMQSLNLTHLSAAFVIARIILANEGIRSLAVDALLLSPIILAMQVIYSVSFIVSTRRVRISDLKLGMIPAKNKESEVYLLEPGIGGLSEDDIRRLRRLSDDNKLSFDSILVHVSLPFAPLIFAGALLTHLMRGNVVYYLLSFFNLI
ncbi:MAG: prepilin peptidase [Candidatus Altiarchaeota archaeon]